MINAYAIGRREGMTTAGNDWEQGTWRPFTAESLRERGQAWQFDANRNPASVDMFANGFRDGYLAENARRYELSCAGEKCDL